MNCSRTPLEAQALSPGTKMVKEEMRITRTITGDFKMRMHEDECEEAAPLNGEMMEVMETLRKTPQQLSNDYNRSLQISDKK